jgi:hypothetical protein
VCELLIAEFHAFQRGDDTIKLFFWMDRLRDQARAVGGEVLSHLGNHEWMNLLSMSFLSQIRSPNGTH